MNAGAKHVIIRHLSPRDGHRSMDRKNTGRAVQENYIIDMFGLVVFMARTSNIYNDYLTIFSNNDRGFCQFCKCEVAKLTRNNHRFINTVECNLMLK